MAQESFWRELANTNRSSFPRLFWFNSWGYRMGKKERKREQRILYHREFKTGRKSSKGRKKTGGRKVK